MEHKKNQNVELENKRIVFLEFSLVIVLAIMLLAFEWGTDMSETLISDAYQGISIEKAIPITIHKKTPPPPPPPVLVEEFLIHKDDIDIIEEEFNIKIEINPNQRYKLFPVTSDEKAINVPFIIVQDMPVFMGKQGKEGLKAFNVYIQKLVDYPEDARENGLTGTVTVQFTVNKTGKVVDVVILRGEHPVLNAAAIRAIKKSPKWIPGKQRNIPVDVKFTIPVVFALQQQ